jgi:hypothetical protein
VLLAISHRKKPLSNYTDIRIKGSLPPTLKSFTLDHAINQRWVNLLYFIWNLNVKFCEQVYEHPKIPMLIKSDEKFDLVITESFSVDWFNGFAHKLKVPHLTMTSSVPMPWADDYFGSHSNLPTCQFSFFLTQTR